MCPAIAVVLVVLAQGFGGAARADLLSLFDIPPVVSPSVAANVLLTLDDSDSMERGFLPDELNPELDRQHPAYASADFNTLYFDPRVTYAPARRADGSVFPQANFRAALSNPFNGNSYRQPVTVNLSNSYRPRWFPTGGRDGATPPASGIAGEAAYYYDYRPGGVCPPRPLPTPIPPEAGCFVKRVVSPEQADNFANWYQYYSLRILAAKTALSIALSPDYFPPSVRVGWQTINHRIDTASALASSTVVPWSDTTRHRVYAWLFGLRDGSESGLTTPLRKATIAAGELFRREDVYREDPARPAGLDNRSLSCRRNYNLMVTDGQWNDLLDSAIGSRNIDATAVADINGTGVQYQPSQWPLYADGNIGSMADISFLYWISDLRPDANDIVPLIPNHFVSAAKTFWHPANNPARWQHMVNHIVSFGVSSDSSLQPGAATLEALMAGELRWGAVNESDGKSNPGKVDDLYHAAINSRGLYLSTRSPDQLISGFQSIAASISGELSSSTPIVTNTGAISAGAAVYQALYDGERGIGRLLARPISEGTTEDQSTSNCHQGAVGSLCDPIWDAAEENENIRPDQRVVLTRSTAGDTAQGVPFRWPYLDESQRHQLLQGIAGEVADAQDGAAGSIGYSQLGERLVEYLRGSRAFELGRDGGVFRRRSGVALGPVINAAPHYVSNGFRPNGAFSFYLPDGLEGPGTVNHRDFVCANPRFSATGSITGCSAGVHQRKPMVYVAANDGMLHGYDASLSQGGKELLAYVPSLILPRLGALARPTYIHQATVDGPLNSADVFYDQAWHTILIGGLRSGGRGYYALDITDPGSFGETPEQARRIVRWEFTDPDMGLSYGEPIIVKSNDRSNAGTGRWVAIFGNGYNAPGGRALVYVLDVETGRVIRKFDTLVGDVDHPNGISGVTAAFSDSGYTADMVYAGDLHGNLWKIDLRASDPQQWDFALHRGGVGAEPHPPQPIFVARRGTETQAITAAPTVASHPSGLPGTMVYFGTGKYLEPEDHRVDITTQSFYALWDYGDTLTRSDLLEQTFIAESARVGGPRGTSDNPIRWEGSERQAGWFIDFTLQPGERVIYKPVLSGRIVYFVTWIPGTDPCEGWGSSWLMALDRANGGRPQAQPFDHNSDGSLSAADYFRGEVTTGIKLEHYSAGIDAVLRGGSGKVIYADDSPTLTDDGIDEGRWRWRILQEY